MIETGFIIGKKVTRDEMAKDYSKLIKDPRGVDFAVINKAIIERWSISGLAYIKKKAWNVAQETDR